MSAVDVEPGFPEPTEYPPAVSGYIGLTAGVTNPIGALAQQGIQFLEYCGALEPARRLHRYQPDKWNVQQILGHIGDTERTFAYRALRIARGDQSLNPPFEQDHWAIAARHDQMPWAELVEEFRHVRASTVLLLQLLPVDAWTREGAVSGGSITVRALAHAMHGHVEHHRNILRDRYL